MEEDEAASDDFADYHGDLTGIRRHVQKWGLGYYECKATIGSNRGYGGPDCAGSSYYNGGI